VAEDFVGPALNGSLWNVLEQVHRGGVYTAANVRLEGGALVLRTRAENLTVDGTPYYVSSGAVNTSGLFSQRGGRFSARIRLPDVDRSPGYTLHSSMWLFADTGDPGTSGCPQEIDVFEQYAACDSPCVRSAVAGNVHPFTGGRGTGQRCMAEPSHIQYRRSEDYTTNWHEYSVDWAHDWLVMRIDNVTVSSFNDSAAMSAFTDPLFLALTACVMERTPPTPADVLPQEYYVDWVRIWEWV